MALREFGHHVVLGPVAHYWRGLRRVRRGKGKVRVGSRNHNHNNIRVKEGSLIVLPYSVFTTIPRKVTVSSTIRACYGFRLPSFTRLGS